MSLTLVTKPWNILCPKHWNAFLDLHFVPRPLRCNGRLESHWVTSLVQSHPCNAEMVAEMVLQLATCHTEVKRIPGVPRNVKKKHGVREMAAKEGTISAPKRG